MDTITHLAYAGLNVTAANFVMRNYPKARGGLAQRGGLPKEMFAELYPLLDSADRLRLLKCTWPIDADHVRIAVHEQRRLNTKILLFLWEGGGLTDADLALLAPRGLPPELTGRILNTSDLSEATRLAVSVEKDPVTYLGSLVKVGDAVFDETLLDAITKVDPAKGPTWTATSIVVRRPHLRGALAELALPWVNDALLRAGWDAATSPGLLNADLTDDGAFTICCDPTAPADAHAFARQVITDRNLEVAAAAAGVAPPALSVHGLGDVLTESDPDTLDRLLWLNHGASSFSVVQFTWMRLLHNPNLSGPQLAALMDRTRDTYGDNTDLFAAGFRAVLANYPGFTLPERHRSVLDRIAKPSPPRQRSFKVPDNYMFRVSEADSPSTKFSSLDRRYDWYANSIAGTMNEAFGDDEELWKIGFSLIDQFSTVGELVETVLRLR